MRLSATPSLTRQKHRWKRHLRPKKSYQPNKTSVNTNTPREYKPGSNIAELKGDKIAKEFDKLHLERKALSKKSCRAGTYKFPVPKNFDIYQHPEKVFAGLSELFSAATSRHVKRILFSHKSQSTCMASEALLGILATDLCRARALGRHPLELKGTINEKIATHQLINEAGIVAELNHAKILAGKPLATSKNSFVYRNESKNFESASATADDAKTNVAEECTESFCEGLKVLALKMHDDVQAELQMCLAEVLDNAEEHCHRTAPNWYVRSYLNCSHESQRYFELMVMNIGHSIAETFDELPTSSAAKKLAQDYVDRHHSKFDSGALTTVAALQGNISSKKDEEPTRGQGTVRLIETFELIYKAYTKPY
jgi:anti-sigma regulatory factor (Ser/Thr protein kinase)